MAAAVTAQVNPIRQWKDNCNCEGTEQLPMIDNMEDKYGRVK